MSGTFFIYPLTDTGYWIDEGYNLCDRDGTLYTQDGLTVTLEYALNPSAPTFRKRQAPSYGNIPPPQVVTYWSQMERFWTYQGTTYGLVGNYLYVQDGFNVRPALSNRVGSNEQVLYCEANVVQGLKQRIVGSQGRMTFTGGPIKRMPTSGVPANAFVPLPRV